MSAKTIKLRQMGFREALYDTRTSSSTTLIHEGDPKDLDFVASIVEMGAEGILCSNDGTAITLLQSLAKLNLEVPKDLIVAGFDNLSYLSQIKTPLTSVAQPLELISSEAVRLMFERLDNRDRPTKTTSFSGILIERESTRSQQVGGRNS
jgi:DNA-binding LacI/PurR family transcriptional regulator